MTPPIIVPLDGKPAAEHAVPAAAGIASRIGAPLVLVHVHGIVYSDTGEEIEPLAQYVERVAARIRSESNIEVKSAMIEGSPARELCKYAEREGATLVVLATEPKGFAARFLEGSVTETLIRDTAVPVLVLRPHDQVPGETGAFRHVLIPLDGSAESEDVLQPLLHTGLLRGARCTLLAVREEAAKYPPAPEHPRDPAAYLLAVARQVLPGIEVELSVREGTPSEEISRFAADNYVDLLALSTHGRGGLSELLFGSTAMELVRSTEHALLIHRPRGWRKH